jgi:DNA helicase II / ATP-dependent DNA helicase PcrA
MVEPKRVSYSVTSLAIYESCPWLYYTMYVRRVPPPPSRARRAGTSIHKYIADHLRTPQLLPVDVPEGQREMFDRFLASRFNAAPLLCEARMDVRFEYGDVRGRIDAVFSGSEDSVEIVDFKSGRAPLGEELAGAIQLPLYGLWVADRFELSPDHLSWTYFYLRNAAEYTFQPGSDTFVRLTDRVNGVMQAIQAGRFDSTPGCTCWACSRWPARTWSS